MEFRIDAVLPASAEQLWCIFFNVERIAALIPGCGNVVEVQPLLKYTATLKQKIGPFKFEVPTGIQVESHVPSENVVILATGRDKFTGTNIRVLLDVRLDDSGSVLEDVSCRLAVAADMQINGKLASLGFGVVKKKSEEIFSEFERRLKAELEPLSTRAN